MQVPGPGDANDGSVSLRNRRLRTGPDLRYQGPGLELSSNGWSANGDPRKPRGGFITGAPARGSHSLSSSRTERPSEAGIEPLVGSVGDSYSKSLAGTIDGLFEEDANFHASLKTADVAAQRTVTSLR